MCFCFTSNENCHFSSEKRLLPKWVVDFPRERDTFRNKIMEIVEDFDEKSYNNGESWKSSRILRVNPFFSFFFLFSSFFSLFSFFHFFSIFHFSSFSFNFFHFHSFSFIFFHFLSFCFIFFNFSFFFIFF